jgi:hypothetical protein
MRLVLKTESDRLRLSYCGVTIRTPIKLRSIVDYYGKTQGERQRGNRLGRPP